MDTLRTFSYKRRAFAFRNITKLFAMALVIVGSIAAYATPTLSSVSCSNSSYTANGLDNCTVSLTSNAASTTYVALTTNSQYVGVPYGVNVAAGTSTASFTAMIFSFTTSQTATITGTAGGISKTFNIALSSGQTSALQPSSSSLSFGNVALGSGSSKTLTITALGNVPIYVTSASMSGTGFSVTGATAPATLNPGQTVTLSVQFNPTTAGAVTGQISIISSNAPALSIALSGTGGTNSTPALTLSANSLSFGNVSVGTAVSKSVTVTSTGTAPVTISSDAISGTGFSVSGISLPATLNPGQAAVLSIQFNPTTSSSVTGQLSIQSNAPSVSVALSGTGSTTTPTVSSVSCSKLSITGALSDSCNVTLTGSAPTGGVTVALASSNSAVVVPASVTIPATATGASFNAAVSSVSTTQTASLTASTGSISKTVALQLNAAASALSANATSIPFGSVVINTPTTQTVTLTSSGTTAVTVSSIGVSGAGFSVSPVSLPATLNPGQSISLTLTFDPLTTGSATGQLTITSNSASNPTITIGLSGTGNPHRVELSWNAPGSTSNPVVGYNVYRSVHGSNSYGRLNAAVSSLAAYTDSSVQGSTSYDYYVKSVDSAGAESTASNTTTVTIP